MYLKELSMPIGELKPEMDGKLVVIGGAVTEMREITTKNGQKMAFVKIADLENEIEVVIFPSTYQQTVGTWERDHVVLVRGKLSGTDRQSGEQLTECKILVDEAREITIAQAEAYQSTGKSMKLPSTKKKTKSSQAPPQDKADKTPRIYIRLQDSSDQEQLRAIKTVLDTNQGTTEVVLVLGPPDKKQIIKLPGGVVSDDSVLGSFRAVVGEDHVVVQ
jgi:DNA polymerase III alpha subunit